MKNYILPLIALAAILFAGYHIVHSQAPSVQTEPALEPPRSPFQRTLAGAGIVEARSQNVELSPVVPGVITELYVQEGARVAPGALLFAIDDRKPQAELHVAEAALALAQANLQKLQQLPRPESIPPVQAKVRELQARERRARDLFERQERLFEQDAGTVEILNQTREDWSATQSQLAGAEAELKLIEAGTWQPDLLIAIAQVDSAKAELERLRTDVERHQVRAPLRGMQANEAWEVLQINVRPGEFVATPAEQPHVVLGDTGPRRVRVDLDEYEISNFTPNPKAIASPRGAGSVRYTLHYIRVEPMIRPKKSLTGENTERVDTRVLQVIYEFDEADANIHIGQQMDVYIERTE